MDEDKYAPFDETYEAWDAWKEFVDDLYLAWDETIDQFSSALEAGKLPPAAKAAYGKAAPAWEQIVSGNNFTPVMGLVHERMRMQALDVDLLAEQLFKARVAEWNDAVSDYLAQMGGGGKAHLRDKRELNLMKAQSKLDAQGIAATYNRDLAREIVNVKGGTPRANRHVYTSRLRAWEADRRTWKMTQISLHTMLSARDRALNTFTQKNGLDPFVELYPKAAREPICEGWVNRGVLPYAIAKNNPSPFHVGCLHFWRPQFQMGENNKLWVG